MPARLGSCGRKTLLDSTVLSASLNVDSGDSAAPGGRALLQSPQMRKLRHRGLTPKVSQLVG